MKMSPKLLLRVKHNSHYSIASTRIGRFEARRIVTGSMSLWAAKVGETAEAFLTKIPGKVLISQYFRYTTYQGELVNQQNSLSFLLYGLLWHLGIAVIRNGG